MVELSTHCVPVICDCKRNEFMELTLSRYKVYVLSMQFGFFSMSTEEGCEVDVKARRLPDQVPLLVSLTGLSSDCTLNSITKAIFLHESLKSAMNLRF